MIQHTYRKILALFLLCLYLGVEAHAQLNIPPDYYYQQKYWMTRKRLKENFLHVGNEPGDMIPAGEYNKYHPEARYLYHGDGLIKLGWYMAVLATEYHLLVANNQPTEGTLEEIYYALQTVDRLDAVSGPMFSWYNYPNGYLPKDIKRWEDTETSNDPYTLGYQQITELLYDPVNKKYLPASNTLDGFLVRDDVPCEYFSKLKDVDCIRSSSGCYSTLYDDPSGWTRREYYGAEESQDQLVFLFMGLKCIHHFIPASVTYNGLNLNNRAQTQLSRILGYAASGSNGTQLPYTIANPHLSGFPKVARGGDMSIYAYPFAVLGNTVVHGKNFHGDPIVQPIHNTAAPTFFTLSESVAFQAFNSAFFFVSADVISSNKNHQDNDTKEAALVAISNMYARTLMGKNNSLLELSTLCHNAGVRWPVYTLLNNALFPDNSAFNTFLAGQKDGVESMLNSYPCEGSYNYGESNYAVNWNGWNRFFVYGNHLNNSDMNDAFKHFQGHKAGLDYMLLYNLYKINFMQDGNQVSYQSIENLTIPQGSYYPVLGLGSVANPLRQFAEKIESSAVLNNVSGNTTTANVSYHALSEINLKPDFHVKPGALFHAKMTTGSECDQYGYKSTVISLEDEVQTGSTSIETVEIDEDLQIFPNPSKEQVYLKLNQSVENATLQVYSYTGQLMETHLNITIRKGESYAFEIGHLSPGTYTCRLILTDSQISYYGKLAKM
ncbi:MAG: T9SS type A sorting domain-containing protein [Crocinitomicaceae bacterium]|nr:T9SS type A sorting domain-containing protein [Crocinitomicaceae bacterium]NGF74566.1 T9SS type A sorting domain-containing protein [Fluviicola sp. SGL-29]